MTQKTSFQRVAEMNTAFGNPRGNPDYIDFERLRKQSLNIFDEYCELLKALGQDTENIKVLKDTHHDFILEEFNGRWGEPNVKQTRDALCDVQVFAMGAQHFMGADGDADMDDVVDGVMTRFIKDEADKQATIAKHAALGVVDVYFEGEFPKMVMKSARDQPDAPKGKFLKSASFMDTQWRPMPGSSEAALAGGFPVGQLVIFSGKNMGHT